MKLTSPEQQEPEERSAGFILYRTEEGERRYLLLCHRIGGHWGFPKGQIDHGEQELDTAHREVREETGISSIDQTPAFREISGYSFTRDGRTIVKQVVYFLGRAASEEIVISHEHRDGKWLTYEAALERLTYAEARRILSVAESCLRAATVQKPTEEFFARRGRANALLLERANLSIKRFLALDRAVYKEGPATGAIPAKQKELLGLVASTVLRCDDCITYHLVRAHEEGASRAEIEETLAIALVVGGSITIPHLRAAFELLERL